MADPKPSPPTACFASQGAIAVPAQAFVSVLFDADPKGAGERAAQPDSFVDLNLAQIVDALTSGRDEYDLKPFLHVPLTDPDAVRYR